MFAPLFHPAVGGAERQVQLISETLLGLGLAVEALTLKYEAGWSTIECLESGLRVSRIPFNDLCRRYPYVRGLGIVNSAWIGFRIMRAIRMVAHKFDVLHTRNVSTSMAAFALRAGHRCGLKTVASGVNTGPWFDLTLLRQEPVWGPIARRWVTRHVDRWQAISEAVSSELERAGIPQDRITSIPNGVALPETPKRLPERASRFLYLGRVARTAPRDVVGLIEAFSTVAERVGEAELAIVGGGDQLDAARKIAESSAARGRIRLVGYGETEQWMSWAHTLVQPSLFEGMSNALLEGMAYGLACVAYDIPPNREALAKGVAGMLVPPLDRRALAEAMASLASSPGLCRLWGERARKRAEAVYDIGVVARRIVVLYEDLLRRPTRHLISP